MAIQKSRGHNADCTCSHVQCMQNLKDQMRPDIGTVPVTMLRMLAKVIRTEVLKSRCRVKGDAALEMR